MEKVLFDFTYYQEGDVHGGGEYGNVVFKEFLSREGISGCGIFFYENRKIDLKIVKMAEEKGILIHAIKELRNLPAIVREYGYTTIYSALPYSEKWATLKWMKDVRFIGTFHGLRRVELALANEAENKYCKTSDIVVSDYIFRNKGKEVDEQIIGYEKALKAFRNRKIIVVSEHSKYAMMYFYPEILSDEIIVLYSPEKLNRSVPSLEQEEALLKKWEIERKNYGLIISADRFEKNPIRGVLAYDQLFSQRSKIIPEQYKVVVCGVKDKENFMKRIENPERFLLLGYVEDMELETLYKNAQLFLYPTLNEGFGYPPIEAMKYGTICACSVNTSVLEVCQDMVLYFNPLLIDEIAIRILQSFDEEIRKKKEEEIAKKLPDLRERQRNDLKKLVDIILGVDK